MIAKHSLFTGLLGVACLIASTEVRAESKEEAKRSFAELLARRTKAEAAKESAAAAHKAAQTAQPARQTASTAVHSTSLASTSPVFARVSPLAANPVGVNPASNVVPSGFGSGRDAYVEELYVQILGRAIIQSELNYWSRTLRTGVSAIAVANLIWNSQEHQTLVRNGTAPGIPLGQAYRSSLAYGKAHQ